MPAETQEQEKKENETGQEIAKDGDDSEAGWIAVAKSKPRWVKNSSIFSFQASLRSNFLSSPE